jgi:hypothetical protein
MDDDGLSGPPALTRLQGALRPRSTGCRKRNQAGLLYEEANESCRPDRPWNDPGRMLDPTRKECARRLCRGDVDLSPLQDKVARNEGVFVGFDLKIGLLVAVDINLDKAARVARIGANLTRVTGENARSIEA